MNSIHVQELSGANELAYRDLKTMADLALAERDIKLTENSHENVVAIASGNRPVILTITACKRCSKLLPQVLRESAEMFEEVRNDLPGVFPLFPTRPVISFAFYEPIMHVSLLTWAEQGQTSHSDYEQVCRAAVMTIGTMFESVWHDSTIETIANEQHRQNEEKIANARRN